jgi:hypothetical protein
MAMLTIDMSTLGTGLSVEDKGRPVTNGEEISCSSEIGAGPTIDSEPPIALDKFIEQSGISTVTVWRWRRAGMLTTLNICGRLYLTRSEIARFLKRAASGEFAKASAQPERGKTPKCTRFAAF